MKAHALVCDEKQHFSYQPVIVPDPSPEQIAIRTSFSGVSIGTEFALIRNKISWGPYPICTGYMGTGVVEQVGSAVKDYKVGDKVFYRANSGMKLESGEPVSSVCGTHCSHIVTAPGGTHGADHVPDGAPMDLASMFVMPAVGHFGVDMANPTTGEHVVVYGAGLIGQGVIASCVSRGCVVTAVDVNPKSLELARLMGATTLINPKESNIVEEIKKITPDGADVVFECTGLPRCIDIAIELCRTFGKFIWQGNYGSAPVNMHFLPAHNRRLKMFFPCDDGGPAYRRAVINNMSSGRLPWNHAISHRVTCTEAASWYERINKGDSDVIGMIIQWSA